MGLAFALATVGGARATDVRVHHHQHQRRSDRDFRAASEPERSIFRVPGHWFSISSVPAVVGESPTTLANLTFWAAGMGGEFMADGVFDFFPARNFTQARKAAQRFFCAPTSYSTMLLTQTDIVTVKELADHLPSLSPTLLQSLSPTLPYPILRSARHRRPRAVDLGDVAARLPRPGLCWLQEDKDKRHQLVQFVVPALASDMVGPVLALGVRIVTAAGWLQPGCGAPWAASRKRVRVANRVRGHRNLRRIIRRTPPCS